MSIAPIQHIGKGKGEPPVILDKKVAYKCVGSGQYDTNAGYAYISFSLSAGKKYYIVVNAHFSSQKSYNYFGASATKPYGVGANVAMNAVYNTGVQYVGTNGTNRQSAYQKVVFEIEPTTDTTVTLNAGGYCEYGNGVNILFSAILMEAWDD